MNILVVIVVFVVARRHWRIAIISWSSPIVSCIGLWFGEGVTYKSKVNFYGFITLYKVYMFWWRFMFSIVWWPPNSLWICFCFIPIFTWFVFWVVYICFCSIVTLKPCILIMIHIFHCWITIGSIVNLLLFDLNSYMVCFWGCIYMFVFNYSTCKWYIVFDCLVYYFRFWIGLIRFGFIQF